MNKKEMEEIINTMKESIKSSNPKIIANNIYFMLGQNLELRYSEDGTNEERNEEEVLYDAIINRRVNSKAEYAIAYSKLMRDYFNINCTAIDDPKDPENKLCRIIIS